MKFLLLGVLLLSASPSQSTVVLDQDNIHPINGPILGSNLGLVYNRRQAQVVTAGKTGQLTRVDLQAGYIGTSYPLGLEIVHGGLDALPYTDSATPLIISSVPRFGDASLITVDVTSLDFLVTAGDQFSIILRRLDPARARFQWAVGYDSGEVDSDGFIIVASHSYSGGVAAVRDDANGTYINWFQTDLDRGFSTYVDVAVDAVPEPMAWVTMTMGFFLTGGLVRQKRPSAAIV